MVYQSYERVGDVSYIIRLWTFSHLQSKNYEDSKCSENRIYVDNEIAFEKNDGFEYQMIWINYDQYLPAENGID